MKGWENGWVKNLEKVYYNFPLTSGKWGIRHLANLPDSWLQILEWEKYIINFLSEWVNGGPFPRLSSQIAIFFTKIQLYGFHSHLPLPMKGWEIVWLQKLQYLSYGSD